MATTYPAILNVRFTDPAIRDRISSAAGARNMTLAQYLTALTRLHDAMRDIADTAEGDATTVAATLESLGLQTVTA